MGKQPAFLFYAKDFLTDENVLLMNLAEIGAYVKLLAICWLEGSLPDDDKKLLQLIGNPRRSQVCINKIKLCFTNSMIDHKRLVHKRLENEKQKQAERSGKARQSAEKRWNNDQKNDMRTHNESNALQLQVQDKKIMIDHGNNLNIMGSTEGRSASDNFEKTSVKSSTALKSSKPTNPKTGTRKQIEDEFEVEWYAIYPRKVARLRAFEAYKKARKTVSKEVLIKGLERYIKLKPDFQAWKYPATWLNGGCWDDDYSDGGAETTVKMVVNPALKGFKAGKLLRHKATGREYTPAELVPADHRNPSMECKKEPNGFSSPDESDWLVYIGRFDEFEVLERPPLPNKETMTQ